jgi:hypothetical protein
MKNGLSLLLAAGLGCGPVFAEAPRFQNLGVLAGFTGANQKAKVSESTVHDHDGNGRSLQCLMLRAEPDTPNQGCHAEAHLATFLGGEPLAGHPGFDATTIYHVWFDKNCDAASVGFFQYKNHEGPDHWKHLVAIWRMPGTKGSEIHFQVNPKGVSEYLYAGLSPEVGTALLAERWHQIKVTGKFTRYDSGWVEVFINGKAIEWYHDRERRSPASTRIRQACLPDLPGSKWQLQLGGYGFFKDRSTTRATVFVDDIQVWSKAQ